MNDSIPKTDSHSNEILADLISDKEYLREREKPSISDEWYLGLSDLQIALEQVATDKPIRVLDYGCGGSPYQYLFPNADYKRADYISSPNNPIDYLLDKESRIDAPDQTFDLVITTQVAEHVSNPDLFFSEGYRVLVPGGQLVCTTHGQWEDHGCPYDFQRWTAEGLKRDLEKHGFIIQNCFKLTTGPRALLSQIVSHCQQLHGGRNSITGLFLAIFRQAVMKFRRLIHLHADNQYETFRVVSAHQKGHTFYIGLMIIGDKPNSESSK
jgi:SAM-dependent methyltransferase